MRDCMAGEGVPPEHVTAASAGAMRFLNRLLDNETAGGEEWKQQRSASFPHVQAVAPINRFCLCCGDPWPCLGYTLEINDGETP